MSKNKPKKKILFFSSKIDSGGAEKHLVRLVNALSDKSDLEVILVVTVAGGNYEFLLNSNVRYIALMEGSNSYTASMIRAFLLLKAELERLKPSLIFSIQDGPNVVMLFRTLFGNTPVIIGVQNNPILDLSRTTVTRAIKWVAKRLYLRARHMISLSEGVASDYLYLIPKLRGRISVVPNIGWPENVWEKGNIDYKDPLRILACGRLEDQKDYPTLFKALELVKKSGQPVKLVILGRGVKEAELKGLSISLDLKKEIDFEGFTNDVSAYFFNSDIFVLCSRWEGFGNVIVEAMAHKLPVISSDCPHGPAEIIEDGRNGFLFPVGDFNSLADRILELAKNEDLRQQFAEQGHKRASMYKPKEIAEKYYEIFERYLCAE